MYLSLAFLFLLSSINYAVAQVDTASTKDTQKLILLTQVVILCGIVVKAATDWLNKRKEHAERKELLKLQHEMKDKLDENTVITRETTRTVRHDVRNEITALSLTQQLAAKELAVTVEKENQDIKHRVEEMRLAAERAFREMNAGKPQQVEVVNQPSHPVPVDATAQVFPPKP